MRKLLNFPTHLALFTFLTLFVSSSLLAFDDVSIEGIYHGSMKLNDGTDRTIPMQISLTITDEFVDAPIDSPFTYQKVIHGSFVVDDEGGPFPFSQVQYDITTGKIDLRYNRPNSSVTPTSPFSLRYTGHIKKGQMQGRVLSGIKGQIGSFNLGKNASQDFLVQRDKYFGNWVGEWTFIKDNRTIPFKLVLEQSLLTNSNPPQFELEYTAGRTGYADYETYLLPFKNVVIDYLRRNIIIYSTNSRGSSVTLVGSFDEEGNLVGHANSTYQGKTGKFVLSPTQFED